MATDPLGTVLRPRPPAFALLHRPETTGPDTLDVMIGEVSAPDTLSGISLPESPVRPPGDRHDALAIIPYRQIAERGYACPDDGTPLLAMTVTEQGTVPISEARARIGDVPISLSGEHFRPDDDAYADTVRAILSREIGQGAGSNFVIKRDFLADISGYTVGSALALFRRLLERESGAYWTFIVHTGSRTLVGASPERHISLRDGTAVMNPISGTYRYPPSGPVLSEVLRFLDDRKEADELYMVVDEELKMMARICEGGGRVRGPYLKEMARLAHTEYLIEGTSARDPREILHETMFAPAVTGSPLESACRVIGRYEPEGRGYYSGALALIGRDAGGDRLLDSAILIRAADIDSGGRMRIGVGATLVRHSDPASEVAETRAKAAGVLAALQSQERGALGAHPRVRAALRQRNTGISGFWLQEGAARPEPATTLAGRRVLVVDAEDAFTSMMEHQLRSLGLTVTVRRCDEHYAADDHDVVVMGPGPGDPNDAGDPRIGATWSAVRALLRERRPFLAVCLSHQVLCRQLGFDVVRREVPNQGAQRVVDLFGTARRVGFYNTFAAVSSEDSAVCEGVGTVEVSRDPGTGEVHALRGPHFASLQFHAESVLTQDGVEIVRELLTEVLGPHPRAVTGMPQRAPMAR